MNAAHIITRWERIAPMLRDYKLNSGSAPSKYKASTVWLSMLYVALAPSSATSLAEQMRISGQSASHIMQLLEKNKLVEFTGTESHGSRPRKMFTATPLMFQILGIKPESSAVNPALSSAAATSTPERIAA